MHFAMTRQTGRTRVDDGKSASSRRAASACWIKKMLLLLLLLRGWMWRCLRAPFFLPPVPPGNGPS